MTALASTSDGSIAERYSYDQFGIRTILEPNGATVRTASNYNMQYGYTSRRNDAESGLMYFRARYFDTTTGEFTSRDPLEYVDGMSLNRGYFVQGNIDPNGLRCVEQCALGERIEPFVVTTECQVIRDDEWKAVKYGFQFTGDFEFLAEGFSCKCCEYR